MPPNHCRSAAQTVCRSPSATGEERDMDVFKDIATLRAARANMGGCVGLVPTMGYLHDGHLALVAAARERCDHVIASIFVNPRQFGEAADLAAYPRDHERDMALLREAGVDALFLPGVEAMYPAGAETVVNVPSLSDRLMGALRPGHFQGVATVVCKLFNITRPDIAFFGEKDYQQLLVIRRMAADLDTGVEVVGLPTVRDADGLALSSRNVRLSADQRQAALVLNRALDAATQATEQGAPVDQIRAAANRVLTAEPQAAAPGIDVQDALSLADVTGRPTAPVVILLTARFGEVLLIDQRVATPPPA
jgi:pantoate--beta-alanine ligase